MRDDLESCFFVSTAEKIVLRMVVVWNETITYNLQKSELPAD